MNWWANCTFFWMQMLTSLTSLEDVLEITVFCTTLSVMEIKQHLGYSSFFFRKVNLIKCCNTTQKVSMVRQSWEAFPRRKKQSIRKSFSALILDRVAKTTPIHLHYYLRDSLACRNLPVLPSSRRLIGIN